MLFVLKMNFKNISLIMINKRHKIFDNCVCTGTLSVNALGKNMNSSVLSLQ